MRSTLFFLDEFKLQRNIVDEKREFRNFVARIDFKNRNRYYF